MGLFLGADILPPGKATLVQQFSEDSLVASVELKFEKLKSRRLVTDNLQGLGAEYLQKI